MGVFQEKGIAYVKDPGLKKACAITQIEFISMELERRQVNLVIGEEMEQRQKQ